VVGDDAVNDVVAEATPEQLAVARVTNRRTALELRCARGDLLRGEREVVRTRLNRDRDAVSLGCRNHRERVGAGQVQDVGAAPGLPGELDQSGDGEVLGSAWA
jgi:hypothetical protein